MCYLLAFSMLCVSADMDGVVFFLFGLVVILCARMSCDGMLLCFGAISGVLCVSSCVIVCVIFLLFVLALFVPSLSMVCLLCVFGRLL